ncbi:sulfurtransferase TusA family protein [Isoptericola sp. BMS4]|uniref:sulfurtransferase TusA family protein n=1 Tax=Isoptericola sp. BMS4 TaxID=2527875 RepID=UPI00141F8749
MSAGTAGDPVVVDARGLRCPLPVIRLAARARDLPAGTRVVVLTTDPAARHDVPAWARMRGHVVEGDEEAVQSLADMEGETADPTGGGRDDGREAPARGVRRLTVLLSGPPG